VSSLSDFTGREVIVLLPVPRPVNARMRPVSATCRGERHAGERLTRSPLPLPLGGQSEHAVSKRISLPSLFFPLFRRSAGVDGVTLTWIFPSKVPLTALRPRDHAGHVYGPSSFPLPPFEKSG